MSRKRKNRELTATYSGIAMPPVKSNLDTHYNHGDIRQAQKEQTQLANELGAGWPIEVAAKRVGISTEQAYTYIKADPQLQARIFQLRGHPLLGPEETVTAEEQLKQAKRDGWVGVTREQTYRQATKVYAAPSREPKGYSAFDWWTHRGVCPECARDERNV